MNMDPVLPRILLSPDSAVRFRDRCESLALDIDDDYRQYWSVCRKIAESDAFSTLVPWLKDVSSYGCGLLSGLALDVSIPPTPHDHPCVEKLPVADAVIGSVAAHLGVLYSIAGKRNPRQIHDVYFVPEDAGTQLGSGCSELAWHVEDGCNLTRPDWIVLLCLRGGAGVVTSLARCQNMRFSNREHILLTDRPVRLRLDDSFEDAGASKKQVRTLVATARGVEIIYDPAYTVIDGVEAETIVDAVAREADRVRYDVTLSAGDLLVFNNRRMVHWRSALDLTSAARERWIKRALVLSKDPDTVIWARPGVVHG